jgi:hypothetical protein
MVRRFVGVAVCAAAVVGGLIFGWPVRAAQPAEDASANKGKVRVQVKPDLIFLDHFDVTPVPLRDMKVIPPDWVETREQGAPRKWRHPMGPLTSLRTLTDQAHQRSFGPLVGTTAGLSFDGVGVPNLSVSSAPPDTNGAIGATQYVQWVNSSFAVFNKSTGAMILGPAAGNTLWQGFGGRCQTDNDGDPIVLYDKAANRWIMTQFSVSAAPFFQCIAVSTSSDATGTFRRFSFQFPDFNDYPKVGVWPDAYYITYNMFSNATNAFLGSKLCAYDRANMISASGTPGPQQCFQLSNQFGGVLPSDLDGATPPPAGSPNFMVAFDDVNNNGLNLWKLHINWATPSSSSLTGPTKITTTAFTPACNGGTCITQSGTTQQLDSLADRLMYRLAYRNFGDHESLVVNHSVNVSGHSGVRWYEIRNPNGTPQVFQQSTFSPDTNHRWMGSIAMDKSGNMLMGYSVSGSISPTVRFTGRLATDAVNTMQAENNLITGGGSQNGGLSRWGDYSAMTVDPVDDCTFWYTQEYLKASGSFNWSTRIGSFKFASCGGGGGTPDFTVSASPSSVSVTQGMSASTTVTVGSTNGFNSAVSLSASGLPSGVTASFSPASVTPAANGSANSTLTFTASATATTGTVNVTVTGTSGSTSHSATVSLTVNPSGGGGTELVVNGGFEGSSTPWTLTTGWARSTGSFPHTGTGYLLSSSNNNVNATTSQAINIPASATGTLTFWLNVTSAETTTTTQFDKLMIEVRNPAGAVLATLGTFSNLNKGTAGVYSQKTFSMAAFRGQTVQLVFHVTTDVSLSTNFRVDDVSLK